MYRLNTTRAIGKMGFVFAGDLIYVLNFACSLLSKPLSFARGLSGLLDVFFFAIGILDIGNTHLRAQNEDCACDAHSNNNSIVDLLDLETIHSCYNQCVQHLSRLGAGGSLRSMPSPGRRDSYRRKVARRCCQRNSIRVWHSYPTRKTY